MAHFLGTADNDNITGTSDADLIEGQGGNDTLAGAGGNDTLDGGAGNDRLTGGSGNDLLIGGSGDDWFYLSGNDIGRDTFDGGAGTDTIHVNGDIRVQSFLLTGANVFATEVLDFASGHEIGGTNGNDVFNISGIQTVRNYKAFELYEGDDSFIGYIGNDLVYGGAGNDTLNGGAGDDRLDGNSGIDTVTYLDATAGVTVNLGLTTAQVIGGGRGRDTLISIENVTGSNHADRLIGNGAANLLLGGMGNDTLTGGAGNDTLNGGLGVDIAAYAAATAGVRVNLAVAGPQAVGAGLGSDVLIAIEGVIGSAHADTLSGNAVANMLDGGAGNDSLVGLYGNDTLLGGAGADTLNGGQGDDVINGGEGVDTAIFAGGANFKVNLGIGARQATGQGNDVIQGIENLIGGTGNDAFTGNGLANMLNGQAGNDTLLGLGGNDTLVGGLGNDLMDGGAGVDTILFSGAANGIRVNLNVTTAQATGQGNDIIRGVENLTGGAFNDVFIGNAANNLLIGNAGNDSLAGMGGNDTLNGGLGNDTLDGGDGIDTLVFASAGAVRVNLAQTTAQNTGMGVDVLRGFENVVSGNGADVLRGSAGANVLDAGGGNDMLYGGLGNDTLLGGAGDDFLWGEGGNDILTGGLGVDRFAFDANNGSDRVTDFQDGVDRIVIRSGAESFGQVNVTYDPGNLANTVLTFGGTTVTLVGVSYWNITASDFEFI